MKTCYVIDAVRTPIGRYGGKLSSIRPDDLLAHAIRSLLHRNSDVDPGAVEDVIAGAANQAGEDNRNVARMSSLLAGLPVSVPGATVKLSVSDGLTQLQKAGGLTDYAAAENGNVVQVAEKVLGLLQSGDETSGPGSTTSNRLEQIAQPFDAYPGPVHILDVCRFAHPLEIIS